jgi:hypothetical protein
MVAREFDREMELWGESMATWGESMLVTLGRAPRGSLSGWGPQNQQLGGVGYYSLR